MGSGGEFIRASYFFFLGVALGLEGGGWVRSGVYWGREREREKKKSKSKKNKVYYMYILSCLLCALSKWTKKYNGDEG